MMEPRKTRTLKKATAKAPVKFVCQAKPEAKSVSVAGQFSEWSPLNMQRIDGKFQTVLSLPPGEYEYKFIIDGQWHVDPTADKQVPNAFGTANSLVRVPQSAAT